MEMVYKFSPDELRQDFNLIGETYKLGSKPNETGRGKRLYKEMIPAEFEEEAQAMIEKAKYAYSHGLRTDTLLTSKQLVVIRMLVGYCMAL